MRDIGDPWIQIQSDTQRQNCPLLLSTVRDKRVQKSVDGRNRANLGVECGRLPSEGRGSQTLSGLDVGSHSGHKANCAGVVGGIRGQSNVTRLVEFKERTNGHFVLLREK